MIRQLEGLKASNSVYTIPTPAGNSYLV